MREHTYPFLPDLKALLERQFSAFFAPIALDSGIIVRALERFSACLSNIGGKYYDSSLSIEDFSHSDKYATFLYYLSNSAYQASNLSLATQSYYLNKILHSIDVFYEVALPATLLLTHPLGSVLGRAKYGEYLCIYQNCTIGGDTKNGIIYYPTLGNGIAMYAGSKIIGNCMIGDNVIFGANAFILNLDVPSDSIVVGSYPHHRILKSTHNVISEIFGNSALSQAKEIET